MDDVYHVSLQLTHNWPSRNYIIPTVAFAIIYNIPKFFELTTEKRSYVEHFNSSDSGAAGAGDGQPGAGERNQTFDVNI